MNAGFGMAPPDEGGESQLADKGRNGMESNGDREGWETSGICEPEYHKK